MTTSVTLEMPMVRRLSAGLMLAGATYAISPVHPGIPCPLRSLTGIPCPFCGLTRAVAAAFRADFIGSLRFNPGGLMLLIAAIGVVVSQRSRVQVRFAAWVIPTTVGLLWLWNLTLNPTFR